MRRRTYSGVIRLPAELSGSVSYTHLDVYKRQTLPLLASLAVRRQLQLRYGVDCQIKWPNDLLLNGKKIVGILCESVCYGYQQQDVYKRQVLLPERCKAIPRKGVQGPIKAEIRQSLGQPAGILLQIRCV